MKVLQANEVPTGGPVSSIDQVKLAELKEQFDTMQNDLKTKKYEVYLSSELTTSLLDKFYTKFTWKGYESYAISETYDQIKSEVVNGELKGGLATEIVEAAFHFIKNYEGQGVEDAKEFKHICDQFALPMQEINNDRQTLRDISLELVATEQGISVETLVTNLQQEQAQGQY